MKPSILARRLERLVKGSVSVDPIGAHEAPAELLEVAPNPDKDIFSNTRSQNTNLRTDFAGAVAESKFRHWLDAQPELAVATAACFVEKPALARGA